MPESAPPPRYREESGNDTEWLRRLGADDHDALDHFARMHWAALVGFAYDLLGSTDAAEDLAQEALIRLWNRRHELGDVESLRAYLMQSVRRLALNEFRNRKLRDRPDVVERVRAIHEDPITPDVHLEEHNLTADIERALQDLPERRREALVLVRFHGLSYREAATVMGVSTQTLANHVCTALKELRVSLASYEHQE
jgi:RNA polymerase sigma-70 factor (ECF subfamily)